MTVIDVSYGRMKNRDAPTSEDVAAVAGGDVETAELALEALRFDDGTDE
jgi:hypothetical protein